MSGHSKWSTIKRKKGAKDDQKGKIFSKLSRVITIAVLEGGGVTDPGSNVKLRLAVEKAKQVNMPKDTIQRAVEKGKGADKDSLKEVVYEGFGPEGIALLIHVTTDNTNRSLSEIRSILEKNGGKLANQHSVSYLFKKCGIATFQKNSNPEDKIYQFADKIEAFDIEEDRESFSVYFPFENLGKTSELMGDLTPLSPPEVDYKPLTEITLDDEKKAKRIIDLVGKLEDLDDVQNVYGNFDIPEVYLTK